MCLVQKSSVESLKEKKAGIRTCNLHESLTEVKIKNSINCFIVTLIYNDYSNNCLRVGSEFVQGKR